MPRVELFEIFVIILFGGIILAATISLFVLIIEDYIEEKKAKKELKVLQKKQEKKHKEK